MAFFIWACTHLDFLNIFVLFISLITQLLKAMKL